MSPDQLNELYQQPSASSVSMGRVTVDDVVMKSATLFTLMLITAVASWFMLPVAPTAVVSLRCSRLSSG